MNSLSLLVGQSSIATILEFAPSDPTQQTPLSPPVPFDAPPNVSIDTGGIVNATVNPDGTIQFDGVGAGTANISVSALIGGQVFTATATATVSPAVTSPVGSIALSFGKPFSTAPAALAAPAAALAGIAGTGKK